MVVLQRAGLAPGFCCFASACCAISVFSASCLHPPGSGEALEILAGAPQGLPLCSCSSQAVSLSGEPRVIILAAQNLMLALTMPCCMIVCLEV